MVDNGRVSSVSVKVDGSELATALYEVLSSVRVEESVQLPDVFTLKFKDPHFELFDDQVVNVGSVVEIAFRGSDRMVTVTRGEVTAIGVEQAADRRHELVVSGHDLTHRLHKGPKSRTFVQVTDADVADQIAGEHGLSSDIDSTSEVHEYLIQSNQSDFGFLSRRARRLGYELWVREDTLYFKESPTASASPPVLTWGENLPSFRVRQSSTERCDEVTVKAWDPVAKTEIVGQATGPSFGTDAPAAREFHDAAKTSFGDVSRFAGHYPAGTQAEADMIAASLLVKASSGEIVARGEAEGDPMLAAGADVELAGVGKRLAGTYTLTSVQHVYSSDGTYRSRFVSGSKDPDGLVDLMGGGQSEKKGWGSLVMAMVTDIDDPQGIGRVKVRFVDLTDTESDWAPVLVPGGGAERGVQWLPEVGDSVVVGFEHDDKSRPLVLGALWNSEDPPPYADGVQRGQQVVRGLRSRNGHVVEMRDDRPGSMRFALGDDSVTLSFEQGEANLESQTKLTLKAPQIEIAADGEVKISGAMVRLN